MKVRTTLYIIALLATTIGFGQDKSITKLADEVNNLLSMYEQLNPWEEKVALKDVGLDYQTLRKNIPDDEDFSTGKDSIPTYILQEYCMEKLLLKIDTLFKHKDLRKHDVTKLLKTSLLVSGDKKLYNLVMDENTGGSYHSRISAVYYVPDKGTAMNVSDSLNTDGYQSVEIISTKTGHKYLLQGGVLGCNTCYGEYITLIHFEKGRLVVDFDYNVATRGYEEAIIYDKPTKAITVTYTTSDLTPLCGCTEPADDDNDDDDTTRRQCSCRFTFDGSTFVLASESSEVLKE